MIIMMVDLLLASKILYSTKLKKCKADYSSRLYQFLFPKKDKFSLPAVKLALTSTFMNWFICLSTTTTVNIGHEAVAIRSKLDLGFRCNETLICYWASSLIDFLSNFLCFLQDCVFTKNFSDTALHVYWTGALRIYNCNNCCKRWYFTFNGAECSAPLPIDGVVYMATGGNQNLHRVRHIEGHCNNIHKGKVRVGFWIGNCASYGNADGKTGWNSVSRIFVEEVPKAQA